MVHESQVHLPKQVERALLSPGLKIEKVNDFGKVYKTATCHTTALILLFIFFVVLIVLSSLGNAIIIVILYPQICGSTKSRTARHFKIKISLAVSGAV